MDFDILNTFQVLIGAFFIKQAILQLLVILYYQSRKP